MNVLSAKFHSFAPLLMCAMSVSWLGCNFTLGEARPYVPARVLNPALKAEGQQRRIPYGQVPSEMTNKVRAAVRSRAPGDPVFARENSATYLETGGDGSQFLEDITGAGVSLKPGDMRFRVDVCKDVDTAPESRIIDETVFVDFLKSRGYSPRVIRARDDLYYVEFRVANRPRSVRLRVALLGSSGEAGSELHRAVLQHGAGSWGVHRSNVAVLAPIADLSEMIEFAAQTRIACWGVLTHAARDDSFVVPGGYFEL